MAMLDRLPALPLVASDPYFSIWMPADTPTQTDSCHWSGPEKPLRGSLTVDGAAFRFLGAGPEAEAELTAGMDEGEVERQTLTAVPWGEDFLVELSAECREQIGRFVEIEKE